MQAELPAINLTSYNKPVMVVCDFYCYRPFLTSDSNPEQRAAMCGVHALNRKCSCREQRRPRPSERSLAGNFQGTRG